MESTDEARGTWRPKSPNFQAGAFFAVAVMLVPSRFAFSCDRGTYARTSDPDVSAPGSRWQAGHQYVRRESSPWATEPIGMPQA